jgi:hypothetical protein
MWGSTSAMRRLLEAGALPNFGGDGHPEPLLLAAQEGYAAAVRLLLEFGADPDVVASLDGSTALMMGALRGHEDIVNQLLLRKADPDIMGFTGGTALAIALQEGRVTIVLNLLQHGADPNQSADAERISPLMIAAGFGSEENAEALMQYGALTDLRSSRERTAMTYAKEYGPGMARRLAKLQVTYRAIDHAALAEMRAAKRAMREAHREQRQRNHEKFGPRDIVAMACGGLALVVALAFSFKDRLRVALRARPKGSSKKVTKRREQLQREKEKRLCVICMDRPKTHALLPCAHKCVCESCAGELMPPGNAALTSVLCPLCRHEVTSIVKVFE